MARILLALLCALFVVGMLSTPVYSDQRVPMPCVRMLFEDSDPSNISCIPGENFEPGSRDFAIGIFYRVDMQCLEDHYGIRQHVVVNVTSSDSLGVKSASIRCVPDAGVNGYTSSERLFVHAEPGYRIDMTVGEHLAVFVEDPV